MQLTHPSKMLIDIYPDGHNDLLIFLRAQYKNRIYDDEFKRKFEKGGLEQHVDLPRLDKGKQGGAFWSAFMPCPLGNGTDFADSNYDGSKTHLFFNLLRSTSWSSFPHGCI